MTESTNTALEADTLIQVRYQDALNVQQPLEDIFTPERQEQLIELNVQLMRQMKAACQDNQGLNVSEMAFVMGHMIAQLAFNVVNLHGPTNLTVNWCRMFYQMILRAFLAAGIRIV